MGEAAEDMITFGDEYDLIGMMFGRPRRTTPLEDFATTNKGDNVTTNIRDFAEAQLRRNELERQRLLQRLALLDQFGAEDPWADETVIFYKRKFDGPVMYTYVALKIGGVWFVTGSHGANRSFQWEQLVEEHLAKAIPGSLYVADAWKRYEDVD